MLDGDFDFLITDTCVYWVIEFLPINVRSWIILEPGKCVLFQQSNIIVES